MNRKEKMSLCIFEEFFTPHGQKDSRPKKKRKRKLRVMQQVASNQK